MSRIHDALRRGAPSPGRAPRERRPDAPAPVPEPLRAEQPAAPVAAPVRPAEIAPPPKVAAAKRAAQADAVLRTLGYTPAGPVARPSSLVIALVVLAAVVALAWAGWTFIR